MANQVQDEHAATTRMADALDFNRLDEIGRLAALVSSYWRSVGLAAGRGDALSVITHCKQVAAVTREAFALVKETGEEAEDLP
jgi:hypothetical protein